MRNEDQWIASVNEGEVSAFCNVSDEWAGESDREIVPLVDGRYEVRHVAYTGERFPLGVAGDWAAAVALAA